MNNRSRFLILPLFYLVLISGCKRKITENDTEQILMVTMDHFLNSSKKIDTSKVKFTVLDVLFFEDKSAYDCEFKVHLVSPGKDTTGIIAATISKDFERVNRK